MELIRWKKEIDLYLTAYIKYINRVGDGRREISDNNDWRYARHLLIAERVLLSLPGVVLSVIKSYLYYDALPETEVAKELVSMFLASRLPDSPRVRSPVLGT
jgi:hypothetical protein